MICLHSFHFEWTTILKTKWQEPTVVSGKLMYKQVTPCVDLSQTKHTCTQNHVEGWEIYEQIMQKYANIPNSVGYSCHLGSKFTWNHFWITNHIVVDSEDIFYPLDFLGVTNQLLSAQEAKK